jgi:hypothetical protein|nr:MAG TPA: transmembrane protein [Caudoviricetes sp.]
MKQHNVCLDINFCGALTILFIALKLTGVISWPWLWVWSPLLIGYAVVILFFIIALIFWD